MRSAGSARSTAGFSVTCIAVAVAAADMGLLCLGGPRRPAREADAPRGALR